MNGSLQLWLTLVLMHVGQDAILQYIEYLISYFAVHYATAK